MRRITKLASTLALSAALCLGCAALAFASQPPGGAAGDPDQRPTVTFVNHEEKFSFVPGDNHLTDTDLFDGLKGVMPGDERIEVIDVTNGSSATVEIFLRAEAHDDASVEGGNHMSEEVADKIGGDLEKMNAFLDQLEMWVYDETGKEIYHESPDQTDGLSENVSLGYFAPGSSKALTVKLVVPSSLTNDPNSPDYPGVDFSNFAGEVDWVFTVTEYDPYVPPTEDPDDPDDPLPPVEPDEPLPDTGDDPKPEGPLGQTGDTAPLALLAGVAVLAAVLVLVAAVMRRFGRR